MALETTDNRKEYSGNGVTTGFSFPYYFLEDADLIVILRNNTTGIGVLQVITTNYTVTGAGVEAGGTVTMLVAPPTGYTLIMYRDPSIIQDKDFRENDSFPAEQAEEAWDRAAMISQRLSERIDRSVRVSEDFVLSGFDLELPSDLNEVGSAGKVVIVNATEDGFEMGPTADDISNAQTYAANAAASASASAASATSSSGFATASSASATASAASAAAAALSAASNLWRDVIFLTVANSPYSVTSATRGKMLAIDSSGGAVVINLPQISTLDLVSAPFALGIKKTSSDGNTITVNRAGTDTIDGATTKSIAVAQGGTTLIPDTDPSPDQWISADFGASAGNLTQDKFTGDGTTTVFTLSVSPGSKQNTAIYLGGVYQSKDNYSVSAATLTFTTAPPLAVPIEVMSGTLLTIGAPSDGTVKQSSLDGSTTASIKDIINLSVAASVASNAMTIALKDKAGNNPSAASPVTIGMRSATLTSGLWNLRQVTAALSVVISSGSTVGHSNATAMPIFVYLIDNAGTLELAFSQQLFDEAELVSTTAEGGAGAADSANVMYSTTARSNVPCRLIAKLTSNQTTAGTYTAVPTNIAMGDVGSLAGLARSSVYLYTGNGYGSTATKIRRYTSSSIEGTDLTYADSAANGTTITVNTAGVYAIERNDSHSGANADVGASVNSGNLTTNVSGLSAVTERIFTTESPVGATTSNVFCGRTRWFNKGDIIRPHDNVQNNQSTAPYVWMSVTRIA